MQATLSTPMDPVGEQTLTPDPISTGPSAWAYRLAGLLLLGALSVTAADAWLSSSMPSITSILINTGLAIGLFFLNNQTRQITIIHAIFSLVVWPILLLFETDIITTLVLTVMNCGVYAPIILLLTGQSKAWRLITAVGVYLSFGLGLYSLLFLLVLIGRSM